MNPSAAAWVLGSAKTLDRTVLLRTVRQSHYDSGENDQLWIGLILGPEFPKLSL